MDKTKIDWADATWNPVTGCLHSCPYCYARGMAKRYEGHDQSDDSAMCRSSLPCIELHEPLKVTRLDGKTTNAPYPFGFKPTFHRYRLNQLLRWTKPRNIFVCSMADLFGEWVPTEWISAVIEACKAAPQHRYMFLTKNPKRYIKLIQAGILPLNNDRFWYGTTCENPMQEYFF